MKKIAVLNQKGGVGKTTSVANIAAALARMGKKVVVLDFDPQAHLTIHLGLNPEETEIGSYRVLTRDADFKSQVKEVRENLWLMPANIDLVGAESELVSVVGREIILKEAVEGLDQGFDYMIIDCAPSLGLLTLNALAAVEDIMIPLQPHFLALQGFGKLLQTVNLVSSRINPKLSVKWVLLCMYDSRTSLSSEVKSDIQAFLDKARGTERPWSDAKIIPVHIRRNIKLAEAPSYGKTIYEYEEQCNGAEDYYNVAKYLNGTLKPEDLAKKPKYYFGEDDGQETDAQNNEEIPEGVPQHLNQGPEEPQKDENNQPNQSIQEIRKGLDSKNDIRIKSFEEAAAERQADGDMIN